MSIHKKLEGLAGNWTGTNRLHMPWMPQPIHESPSTAVVATRVAGQCLEIAYTWSYEGKEQEGLLLIDAAKTGGEARAAFTDSWHSAHTLMECRGTMGDDGRVSVKGSYSVPDHPDWGWRTEIIPGDESFEYKMYNVSPEGQEDIAVETIFTRAA